jgi:hypothetical protein
MMTMQQWCVRPGADWSQILTNGALRNLFQHSSTARDNGYNTLIASPIRLLTLSIGIVD